MTRAACFAEKYTVDRCGPCLLCPPSVENCICSSSAPKLCSLPPLSSASAQAGALPGVMLTAVGDGTKHKADSHLSQCVLYDTGS